MADQQTQLRGKFTYLIVSGVTFVHDEDGWKYAFTADRPIRKRGEPEPPPPTYYGPFAEPEDAARDASVRFGVSGDAQGSAADAYMATIDKDFERLIAAFHAPQ